MERILEIINLIKLNKGEQPIAKLNLEDHLKDNIGFNSFDLAELTVRIEDVFDIDIFENGIINTVGEIIDKLNDNQ